ncbi:MAG: Gfo/Idh/MocA family oxidoreductase, partial [Verrucomicrobiae bacterium]|nr:Gfo/Idh/MocA family oxidoreductase [Verrucomicrobiae bacterium]
MHDFLATIMHSFDHGAESVKLYFDGSEGMPHRETAVQKQEATMKSNTLSRRKFIRNTSVAGAALSFPSIIPASALGRDGNTAASERLVMGAIGLGGRGTYDLKWLLGEEDVQIVAVCDVQRVKREAAKKQVDETYGNQDCTTYRDMRELFEKESGIDAMLIATGDRWHGPAAIMAMQAGKDLYCEKPGTMTVAEGRALVNTARRYDRVFQTGAQRLCEPKFAIPSDMALKGILGEIKTVRAHLWPKVQDVT